MWQQYEQQKHDLFLPDRPNNPALTAAPGVAGYLTSSSMRQTVPNVPPPMTDMANNGNDSLIWSDLIRFDPIWWKKNPTMIIILKTNFQNYDCTMVVFVNFCLRFWCEFLSWEFSSWHKNFWYLKSTTLVMKSMNLLQKRIKKITKNLYCALERRWIIMLLHGYPVHTTAKKNKSRTRTFLWLTN